MCESNIPTLKVECNPSERLLVTSYFANWRKLVADGYLMVSIARYPPRTFDGYKIPYVAPQLDILYMYKQGMIDRCQYEQMYRRQLKDLVDRGVLPSCLKRFLSGKFAFCCYEKPDDFCHRHILSAFLKEHYKITIPEYGVKESNS